MKKLLIALFLLVLISCSEGSSDNSVYICTGPKSKRYHKTEHCKGLDRCSKSIKKISIEEAQDMGRTPCGYCY